MHKIDNSSLAAGSPMQRGKHLLTERKHNPPILFVFAPGRTITPSE
jgi:hypothetical protein